MTHVVQLRLKDEVHLDRVRLRSHEQVAVGISTTIPGWPRCHIVNSFGMELPYPSSTSLEGMGSVPELVEYRLDHLAVIGQW